MVRLKWLLAWRWRLALYGVVMLCLLPVILLMVEMVRGEATGPASNVVSALLPHYLSNTFISLPIICAIAMLIAITNAWLVCHYDFPLRGIIEWMLVLPLIVPAYIAAYCYRGLLDFTGPIQRMFRTVFNLPVGGYPVINFAGVGAFIFTMSFALYPYLYLVLCNSFKQQSAAILENTQTLHRPLLFSMVLPVARPAIASGIGLIMMETLGEYGAAWYLGVSTFTTGIINAWSSFFDLSTAIRLAMWLGGSILVLILLEHILRGRAQFTSGPVPPRTVVRKRLRGMKGIGAMVCGLLPSCIGFGIPVGMIVRWLLRVQMNSISLRELVRAVGNTGLLLGGTIIFCILAAILLAYAPSVSRHTVDDHVARLGTIGYAVSGSILGIGVILLVGYNSALGRLLLAQTAIALVYACVLRYIAVSYFPIRTGINQLSNRYAEISLSLGVAPMKTLMRVNIPILYRVIIGGGLFVAIDMLRELPLAVMLRPFNFETLALRTFRYAADERMVEAAPSSLILLAGGAVLLVAARFVMRKTEKGMIV